MSVTMRCSRCGNEVTGKAGEVIIWDLEHDKWCPALGDNSDD